ncbi:MAG: hypothetical protein JNJ46_04500 [Myxococcales bacterium]|nr:hypothetical protein [Myxococcales bacterium]
MSMLRRLLPLGWLSPCLLLSGCLGPVMINGTATPRQNLEYGGQPYAVRHLNAHPQPGGPSSGVKEQGGRITGMICGSDVDVTVTHAGDHVELYGVVENQHTTTLQIAETQGFHTISGALAFREVKLELFGDRLRGYIGRCPVDMQQEGDALVETVVSGGQPMRLQLNGLGTLWKIPAAPQAIILPMVVSCLIEKTFENLGRNPPALGFGGPVSAQPPNTLRFATPSNRDCGSASVQRPGP